MSALKKLGLENRVLTINSDYSSNQLQTEKTFDFKWKRRETYESEAMKAHSLAWLNERYLGNQPENLTEMLDGSRKIILDAGCGSGYSALLFFGDHLHHHDYLGVDISDAVHVAETRFKEAGYAGEFIKSNLMNLPIPDASVDVIFSEGVLHHTDNTEQAIKTLTQKLKKGGFFLFYVYRKKATIREYTDDFIRNQLKTQTDGEAWESLKALTQLGIALGKLNIDVDISEDIPYLGIQKGKINLQRFFYWNICKVFYKAEYSLEEMNHINFDWFRPLNCHRHTPEEIKNWCQQLGLNIERINIQEAGITVVAKKS